MLEGLVSKYIDGLPPFLSIHSACEVAGGCSPAKMYVLMGDRKVRALKMGDKTLIDTASLLDFLANLPEAKIAPPNQRNRKGEHVEAQGSA
jgi:hypothetical protein